MHVKGAISTSPEVFIFPCRGRGLPQLPAVKNLPEMQETQETPVRFLGQRDPLEEGMATRFSILAGKNPWTEEPGRLQSMGSQTVGHI